MTLLLQVLETYYTNDCPRVSLESFLSELFVLALDTRVNQSPSDSSTLPILRDGELVLNARFSNVTKESTQVLTYQCCPSLLTISGTDLQLKAMPQMLGKPN